MLEYLRNYGRGDESMCPVVSQRDEMIQENGHLRTLDADLTSSIFRYPVPFIDCISSMPSTASCIVKDP